jgi:hypothetical protein
VAASLGIAKARRALPENVRALGWVSAGRRGRWIAGGYGASAVCRPLLAAAPAWGYVLAASLVAGVLWEHVTPEAVFVLGACAAGLALLLVLVFRGLRLV